MVEVTRTQKQNPIAIQTHTEESVNTGRYSRITLSVAAKVVLLGVTLYGLSNMPGADAGPLAYSACCTACIQSIGGLTESVIACIKACLPVLLASGP